MHVKAFWECSGDHTASGQIVDALLMTCGYPLVTAPQGSKLDPTILDTILQRANELLFVT